jgi:hypothetical protein
MSLSLQIANIPKSHWWPPSQIVTLKKCVKNYATLYGLVDNEDGIFQDYA